MSASWFEESGSTVIPNSANAIEEGADAMGIAQGMAAEAMYMLDPTEGGKVIDMFANPPADFSDGASRALDIAKDLGASLPTMMPLQLFDSKDEE